MDYPSHPWETAVKGREGVQGTKGGTKREVSVRRKNFTLGWSPQEPGEAVISQWQEGKKKSKYKGKAVDDFGYAKPSFRKKSTGGVEKKYRARPRKRHGKRLTKKGGPEKKKTIEK